MTALARFLLVLTGLAPIALVESAVDFEQGGTTLWKWCALGALVLLALCVLLLHGVASRVAPVPKKIEAPAAKESEPLAFLVAYALPLVSAKHGEGSHYGLLAFAMVMGLVIWQQQLFQINPLFAVLGYKFFLVKVEDEAHVLVVTRKRVLSAGVAPLVRISDYLWLDA